MRFLMVILVLSILVAGSSSAAWEIRSDVPESVNQDQSILLNVVYDHPGPNCFVCLGYDLEYDQMTATAYFITQRIGSLGDPCSEPSQFCDEFVEIFFDEPGTWTLTLIDRVISPSFGGDSVMAEYEIEVEALVPLHLESWGVIKALYR